MSKEPVNTLAISVFSILMLGPISGNLLLPAYADSDATAPATVPAAAPATASPPASVSAPATNSPAAASSSSSSSSFGQTQSAITGSVKASSLTVEKSIKLLGETATRLKDAAWDAFCEVQQPDEFYAGGPDVIGPMVIPAINGSGFIEGGLKPPRKKWLDYFVKNVTFLCPQLLEETEQLELPSDVGDDTKNALSEMKQIASGLPADCQALSAISQGPKYDNMAIARAAQLVLDHLKDFERLRKDLYRSVRTDLRKFESKKSN